MGVAYKQVRILAAFCAALFALCLFLLLPVNTHASAEEINATSADSPSNTNVKTIRVGYYESRNFLEGANSDIKSGYGYEYLQRVGSYAGWRFEYVYGNWNELYTKLINGEIDLLPGVSYIEKHASDALIPSLSMLDETFYIYRSVFDDSIAGGNISSLSGKRVGIVSGSSSERSFTVWRSDNNCDAQVVPFSSASVMHQAFDAGEIDTFVSSDNVAHDFEGVIPIEIVGKDPYYLAVSKDRPDLLSELNNVQAVIQSQDRAFIDELKIRYSADSAASVYLTSDEINWIEEHNTLVVGYLNNYLPYSDTDDKGNATGLMVDVLTATIDSLPIEWEPNITFLPFDDQQSLYDSLKSGNIDMAFPVGGETWYAEKNRFLRSSAVVSASMELALLDNSEFEAATKRIAVNKHNLLQQNYASLYYPDAEFVECESIDDCLLAVARGRAGSTIVNGLRASALLSSYAHFTTVQLPKSDDRCFGVMEGNGTLLQLINRGLGIIGGSYGENVSYHYTKELFTYTINDFIRDNWVALVAALLLIIVLSILAAVRHFRKMREENQREVEQNRRLEEALMQAEQASKAKDVLLGNFSHDIRTPLNGILGILDLNANCNDVSTIKENKKKAQQAAQQLLGMVDDLLEMSELKSGNVEIGEESFSLLTVVNDVLTETKELADREGISVTCANALPDEYDNRLIPKEVEELLGSNQVVGSAIYVQKVLFGIFDNAVRYNVENGSVEWRVSLDSLDQNRVFFTFDVCDTGQGMSKEYLVRLFEPFSQAQTTARSLYPGSGLGMPIARSLVELMDGTLDVESTLGVGTKVRLRIPFVVDKQKNNHENTHQRSGGVKGMCVLLAEDNELNLEISQCALEREGVKTIPVRDGAQAVQAFKESTVGSIDAIVMDVMMPVMNGCDATKAIRELQRPDSQNVPIIALTANVANENRKKALDVGMNEYLEKPVDFGRLISVLARYRQR